MTATLERRRAGLAVLLVYGLKVPVPRPGQPGWRLTVQPDGAVWVQPVGFASRADASMEGLDLQLQCRALGLWVEPIPPPGDTFGFVVRRR